MTEFDYDVLVIGSGFGGSVTALRLTEKGYRVGVLEAGRRWADEDFPKTSWRTKDFLWAPRSAAGIQRIHVLKDVVILAGAGVGGGSLNYANTLYEPLAPFFNDPQWAHITDWRAELAPTTTRPSGCSASRQTPRYTIGRRDAEGRRADGRRRHLPRRRRSACSSAGRRNPASRSTTRSSVAPVRAAPVVSSAASA